MKGRARFLAFALLGLGALAAAVIAKTRCRREPTAPISGVRIVYSIDLDIALDDRANDIARDLELGFAERTIRAVVRRPLSPPGALTVIVQDPGKQSEIEGLLGAEYRDLERRTCEPDASPVAICVVVSPAAADAIRKTALDNAVETIRRRIDTIDVDEASVLQRDGQIVIELPDLDADKSTAVRDLIARSGKLELKVVDDGSMPGKSGRGSVFMTRLFTHVGSMSRAEALAAGAKEGDPTDPLARELGVYVDYDYWPVENQPDRSHSDYYVKAYDQRGISLPVAEAKQIGCTAGTPDAAGNVRCDLAGWQVADRYLAKLAALDPSFKVPDDHQIAYEVVEPTMGTDRRRYWRSYYLWRAARLTGRAIANVEAQHDPYSNQPIILLDFNREGARVFGDLTAEIVGQKLATMIDGRVSSAPIINGAIKGGRASITMGGSDPDRQTRERDELVRVLKAGSLPAPLREESRTQFGPR